MPPNNAPRERALDEAELKTLAAAVVEKRRVGPKGREFEQPTVSPIVAAAIFAQLATAARPGEIAKATWTEVDLKAGTWKIPAATSKTGRPHLVALSPFAVEAFAILRDLAVDSPRVVSQGRAAIGRAVKDRQRAETKRATNKRAHSDALALDGGPWTLARLAPHGGHPNGRERHPAARDRALPQPHPADPRPDLSACGLRGRTAGGVPGVGRATREARTATPAHAAEGVRTVNRYSITYKFDDGSAVEIPLVDVQRRRIEQLQALAHLGDSEPLRRELATLAGAVVEQEQTAQKRIADGAAISAALRKKKRTALQDAVNEALKALGDTATNAEIRLWCLSAPQAQEARHPEYRLMEDRPGARSAPEVKHPPNLNLGGSSPIRSPRTGSVVTRWRLTMARKEIPAAAPAPRKLDPNPLDERLYGYRLLTCRHVTEMTGSTYRQRAKHKDFPPPIRITQKIRLYPSREILDWIESQRAAR